MQVAALPSSDDLDHQSACISVYIQGVQAGIVFS